MTADRRGRLRGRRGLQVIRHVEPAEAVAAYREPERHRPLDAPGPGEEPWHCQVCGGPCEEAAALQPVPSDVSRETSAPLPALRKDQVARLEALTALWERQVRAEGPPDATLLYTAPLPPVPPLPRGEGLAFDPEAVEAVPPPVDLPPPPAADPAPPVTGPPRRVSDWVSRHDPRSLEYAVRDRLRHPVPIQDLTLEHGPVLDQGTTPPLSVRDASGCTGMAAVAARNVLELESSPLYTRHADQALLGASDGLAAYHRAQDLDAVSGHDYPGTSVLAVMKAGQEAGWWDTYLWALGGTRDVAQVLLQLRAPVVIGVPWGPALEAPDAAGVLTPAGTLNLGHSLAVIGIRRTARDGRPGPYFVLQQSRGEGEGVGGLVYLHHKHLAGLLAGRGEAAVPLPRWGLPEPTP